MPCRRFVLNGGWPGTSGACELLSDAAKERFHEADRACDIVPVPALSLAALLRKHDAAGTIDAMRLDLEEGQG